MSKKAKAKINPDEPATRVARISLSLAEINVLVKHHIAQSRRWVAAYGKAVFKDFAQVSVRDLKVGRDLVREKMEAHHARAKALAVAMASAEAPQGIALAHVEDEMVVLHRDGKHWLTLRAKCPKQAQELADWIQDLERKAL